MKARIFHRVIGLVLLLGWIAFVLLLAGVGSELLTKPPT